MKFLYDHFTFISLKLFAQEKQGEHILSKFKHCIQISLKYAKVIFVEF